MSALAGGTGCPWGSSAPLLLAPGCWGWDSVGQRQESGREDTLSFLFSLNLPINNGDDLTLWLIYLLRGQSGSYFILQRK